MVKTRPYTLSCYCVGLTHSLPKSWHLELSQRWQIKKIQAEGRGSADKDIASHFQWVTSDHFVCDCTLFFSGRFYSLCLFFLGACKCFVFCAFMCPKSYSFRVNTSHWFSRLSLRYQRCIPDLEKNEGIRSNLWVWQIHFSSKYFPTCLICFFASDHWSGKQTASPLLEKQH